MTRRLYFRGCQPCLPPVRTRQRHRQGTSTSTGTGRAPAPAPAPPRHRHHQGTGTTRALAPAPARRSLLAPAPPAPPPGTPRAPPVRAPAATPAGLRHTGPRQTLRRGNLLPWADTGSCEKAKSPERLALCKEFTKQSETPPLGQSVTCHQKRWDSAYFLCDAEQAATG